MDSETLRDIITDMDLPLFRSEINIQNLRWFLRNLCILNGDHPRYKEAINIIKKMLRASL